MIGLVTGCSGGLESASRTATSNVTPVSNSSAASSTSAVPSASSASLSSSPVQSSTPVVSVPFVKVPVAVPAPTAAPMPVVQNPAAGAPACTNPITIICNGQTSHICSGQSFTCVGNGSAAPAAPATPASPVVAVPAPAPMAPPPVVVAPPAVVMPAPMPPQISNAELNTGIGRFVNTLYEGVLNRAPDESGFHYWLNANASGSGCLAIAAAFLHTSELAPLKNAAMQVDIVSQSAYIAHLYRGLLGREVDTGAYDFWINATYKNKYPITSLETDLLSSAEFKNRCASLGLAQ
jgi:hypothetical protein